MNKIIALIKGIFQYAFVRFAFVGGIATIINYTIYLVLIHFDLGPNTAYLLAFAVSLTCNYFLSSYITFRVNPSTSRALQFTGAHLINLVNELLLLNLFLKLEVNKIYAPILVFIVAFPINFFIVRFAMKNRFLQRFGIFSEQPR